MEYLTFVEELKKSFIYKIKVTEDKLRRNIKYFLTIKHCVCSSLHHFPAVIYYIVLNQ